MHINYKKLTAWLIFIATGHYVLLEALPCVHITFVNCLDAEIKLVGGSDEQEGRVEIMYQGIWGTICDKGWDDTDATVVCRELGFLEGIATTQTQFGSGTGPVWLRQVDCSGDESKLSHCVHNGAGNTKGCPHARDAGVQCTAISGRQLIFSTPLCVHDV